VLEVPSGHSTAWIGTVHRTLAAMARRRSKRITATMEIASVQGEIHGSTRDATQAPSSDEPAVVFAGPTPTNSRRDEVGPIPAYVRAPGRRPGHLALVAPTFDAGDEPAAKSDACLVPPVVPPAVRKRTRGRLALPGGVAAILTAAIVGTFFAPKDRDGTSPSATSPTIHAAHAAPAVMPGEIDRVAAMQDLEPPSARVVRSSIQTRAAAQTDDAIVIVVPRAEDGIEDALADGRAVRHDGWLVWTVAEPAEDWWRAANLCRARTLAGMRGWRLPTVGEARALRRAGVLPKVDSWTITRVVGEDGNWVAGADGRFSARDKHDGSAHATCLRKG
jgi:hypothetical protein